MKKGCKCTLQEVYDNSNLSSIRLNTKNGPIVIRQDIADNMNTLLDIPSNNGSKHFLKVRKDSFYASGGRDLGNDDNIIIGNTAFNQGNDGILLGRSARGYADDVIGIGYGVDIREADGICIGRSSDVRGEDAISIDRSVYVEGNDSYGIGRSVNVLADDCFAIGRDTRTNAPDSFAVGHRAKIDNSDGIGGFLVNVSGQPFSTVSRSNNGVISLPPGKGLYITAGTNSFNRLVFPESYTLSTGDTIPNMGFVTNPINIKTVNNETKILFDYLTHDNISYAFYYHIHGVRVGGSGGSSGDSFFYYGKGLLVNDGTSLSLTIQDANNITSVGGTSVSLTTSGDNLRIEVTGINTYNIIWQCTLQISEFKYYSE